MGLTINELELKTKFKKIPWKILPKELFLKRFKKTVNGEQELKKKIYKNSERWTVKKQTVIK
jgi:hypothetical protein